MDQKRRSIGNNDYSSKSITQSNNNNILSSNNVPAQNSSLNDPRDETWHRNELKNNRQINNVREVDSNSASVPSSSLRSQAAHKYFNAFPALSEERIQASSKPPQQSFTSTDFSSQSRSSKSSLWNGMRIIKNVADPSQSLNNNDTTNFTTLSSKANATFAGKQRILVTPATDKNNKIGDGNNMVTLKKVSGGKKSGISNSPARSDNTNATNAKILLDVSSKKIITKVDEKILSVMPNFMNPLKKNDIISVNSSNPNITPMNNQNELLRVSKSDNKSQNSMKGLIAHEGSSQSTTGLPRNITQQEMTQKQREFFESKFIKRSNSFGNREMKKYGFSDDSKKKPGSSGSSLKGSNSSQTTSEDIDSDWRLQKSTNANQNKNPLSATNALVGIMPSYLKSVATADAQKVKKIEPKIDCLRSTKAITALAQPEETWEPVPVLPTIAAPKSLIGMTTDEISKHFWNDSNFNFVPMIYETLFDDDKVFQNFLDLEKQLQNGINEFKHMKRKMESSSSDSGKVSSKSSSTGDEQEDEKDNTAVIENLMKEMDKLSFKASVERKSPPEPKSTSNEICFVPYSKRQKYQNGGSESFGKCPMSLSDIQAEHERLKNTATFEYFEASTSSNEDLSIAYMFEREHNFEAQFIIDECYEEEQHFHSQDDDNEAEFYANDYENFLAENEKANAEAERIGFNDFITGNRIIDNTIDSVQKSQKPCKYLLEGFCARSDCKFSHNFSNIVCRYWLEGFCAKEHECPFKHSLDESAQMPHYSSANLTIDNYKLDIECDFPALAKNSVQHSQSSSDLISNHSYYGNHNHHHHPHVQNGKNPNEEWPTLDMNGTGRQTLQAYQTTSTGNTNIPTMDSFGINFKIAKKKNRKDKSKFKN